MRCSECNIPRDYDYQEHTELCGLFGWDNENEHFKEYYDGSDGCIHRKSTLDKWWKHYIEVEKPKEEEAIIQQMGDFAEWMAEELKSMKSEGLKNESQ